MQQRGGVAQVVAMDTALQPTYVEGQFVEGSEAVVLGDGGEGEMGEGKVHQVLLVVDSAQLKQLQVVALQVPL